MGVEEVECERVNAKGTRSGEATAGGRSCFALLSAMEINKTPHAARHSDSQSQKLLPPPTVSTDAYVSHSSHDQSKITVWDNHSLIFNRDSHLNETRIT